MDFEMTPRSRIDDSGHDMAYGRRLRLFIVIRSYTGVQTVEDRQFNLGYRGAEHDTEHIQLLGEAVLLKTVVLTRAKRQIMRF
jgi:hypothetical protein